MIEMSLIYYVMISLLCAAASLTNFSKYFLSDRLFYLPGGFKNCDEFYVNFIFIYVIGIFHTFSKHGQKYDQLFVIVMLPDSRRRRLGNVLMFPLNQVNQLALGCEKQFEVKFRLAYLFFAGSAILSRF